MIRVGLVDFDTSHVVAFTQRLNHLEVDSAEWVEGARIVAGCPGDSEMMPERIPGYAEQLRGYGVELVDQPADLLGKIDAVMVESQQGARHRERARPFLEAGLPTFVDKPFAATVKEAEEMIAGVKGLAPIRGYRNLPKGDVTALARAISATGYERYPIPQGERDCLFLEYRHRAAEPGRRGG